MTPLQKRQLLEELLARKARSGLSEAQKSLWSAQQLWPEDGHTNLGVICRLWGPPTVDWGARLLATTRELCQRHRALRTRYLGLDSSELTQLEPDFLEQEGEAEDAWRDFTRPFRLDQAPPIRVRLYRCADRSFVLAVTVHHIAVDLWSVRLLILDLQGKGQSGPDYTDFIAWQRAFLKGPEGQRQRHFWQTQLRHSAETPFRVARSGTPPPPRHQFVISAALHRRARQLAREEGATLFSVLLAAFELWVARWSGRTSFWLTTPAAGRPEGFQAVVGCFSNLIPMWAAVDPSGSFRTLLHDVQVRADQALLHQDYPITHMMEFYRSQHKVARSPLGDLNFSWLAGGALTDRRAQIAWGERDVIHPLDDGQSLQMLFAGENLGPKTLALSISEGREELYCVLATAAGLISDPTPMALDFLAVLEECLHEPDGGLKLPLAPLLPRAPREVEESRSSGPVLEPLRAVWESVLGCAVGADQNFFDIGGCSMLAVTLVDRVERDLGVRIPLMALAANPTLAEQSRILEVGWRRRVVVPVNTAMQGRPLFLIPGLGGQAIRFSALGALIGSAFPVYGCQAFGLDPAEVRDIPGVAATYVAEIKKLQPRGPYSLGGVSMGGVVAFEMAHLLRLAGDEIDVLYLFDSWLPTTLRRWRRWSGLIKGWRQLRGQPSEERKFFWENDETGEPSVWKLASQSLLAYQVDPYVGRVVLFRARQQVLDLRWSARLGWDRYVSPPPSVIDYPGPHESVLLEPAVSVVAAAISRISAEFQSEALD